MKVESWMFLGGIFFFFPVAFVYGYMTNWNELVGFPALLLTGGLCAMVGWYLMFTAKRVGPRPEDRNDGEIHENAGDIGHFSPWSWWPLVLAGGAAVCFLGIAVGWWVFYVGVGLAAVGIIGWVYEYSRGDHAH